MFKLRVAVARDKEGTVHQIPAKRQEYKIEQYRVGSDNKTYMDALLSNNSQGHQHARINSLPLMSFMDNTKHIQWLKDCFVGRMTKDIQRWLELQNVLNTSPKSVLDNSVHIHNRNPEVANLYLSKVGESQDDNEEASRSSGGHKPGGAEMNKPKVDGVWDSAGVNKSNDETMKYSEDTSALVSGEVMLMELETRMRKHVLHLSGKKMLVEL
ncbi:hypothetical protein Ancab_023184 [Ancistrocladus abbreviatus]